MKALLFIITMVVLMIPVFADVSPQAAEPGKGVTERQCALTKDAEIIWDLSEHKWFCCVPKDKDLETCTPITDMKPLRKTSLKPLPPPGKKTIVISPGDSN